MRERERESMSVWGSEEEGDNLQPAGWRVGKREEGKESWGGVREKLCSAKGEWILVSVSESPIEHL